MARTPFRAHGPTENPVFLRPRAPWPALALALAPAFVACVSYEADPVDVDRMLADLDARRWAPSAPADLVQRENGDGASPAELAAFAVTHHPSLRAARAQIGVARALLVEAGLLADPEIGWDGMDALAAQIVNGTASNIDFLAGFGLSVPLPRPGELDAQQGAARWRIEETRCRIALAEWTLARETLVACEDLLEADRLLEQNQDLVQVAERTRDYFARARTAGAATAIEANLAAGDVLSIRADRLRVEGRRREARHRLSGLLGLPPTTLVPIARTPEAAALDLEWGAPDGLVEASLAHRPDLLLLQASYQVAEEELRLAVARQFPPIAIGTGITIVPGVFSGFHRPAIRTAEARRAAVRAELEARVHAVRQEVFDAYEALMEARREARFLTSELLPNAEESLRLAGRAFDAGEVTLLEILSLQRGLVDARTRTTEAEAELRRSYRRLLVASGRLDTVRVDRTTGSTGATPMGHGDENEGLDR